MLGPEIATSGDRIGLLSAVNHAYRIMALVLAALALLWLLGRKTVRHAQAKREQPSANFLDVLKSRWAVFGAVAIGLYVGAEVSIGSIMINFLNQPKVLGLPLEAAGAHLANFYWGGALVGRILGTVLLTRVRAPRLLAACAVVDAMLCATVLASSGPVAGYAALSIGYFNSIMFPTIFTITLERSGVSQSSTSGLLCLAIFGGAVLPMTVGMIADRFGLSTAFAVPLAAYAFIAYFAVAARDRKTTETVAEPPMGASPIP
jgi:FHS family L-fucose permease-like MFS transporter